MPDSSAIPVRRVEETRQAKAKSTGDGRDSSPVTSVSPAGPRKLIRPRLPEGAAPRRYPARVSPISPSPLTHHRLDSAATLGESSHAEAFYFQKQMQSQTLMVFVMDDGEVIEGYIEWYDRNAIKVRHGGRTLIYKSSIKYLYKAADNNQIIGSLNGRP
jgi:sRNA-binding regulator protein Hfq